MENTTEVKTNNSINAKDILEALNKMQDNMAYVNDALAKLETVRSDGPEDIGAQAKAKAMSDVVMCHETTNQKMIALYEKMYDDVRKTDEERKADIAKNTFSELTLKIDKLDMRPQDKISAVLEITESIKEVLLQLMTE